MSATLDQIDETIMATLRSMALPSGTPFRQATRYAGEVTRDGVAQEVLAKVPAVLLAFDGERGEATDAETLVGETETIGTSTWTALVVTTDQRGTNPALRGTYGQSGAYALASLVRDRLNGLPVDGLYAAERLRYAGIAPLIVTKGLYVMAVRFTARTNIVSAELVDESVPLLGIDGHEHLYDEDGAADGAPDPIVEFRSETA